MTKITINWSNKFDNFGSLKQNLVLASKTTAKNQITYFRVILTKDNF